MGQAAIHNVDEELLDQTRFLNNKEDLKDFTMKLLTFRDDVKAVIKSLLRARGLNLNPKQELVQDIKKTRLLLA